MAELIDPEVDDGIVEPRLAATEVGLPPDPIDDDDDDDDDDDEDRQATTQVATTNWSDEDEDPPEQDWRVKSDGKDAVTGAPLFVKKRQQEFLEWDAPVSRGKHLSVRMVRWTYELPKHPLPVELKTKTPTAMDVYIRQALRFAPKGPIQVTEEKYCIFFSMLLFVEEVQQEKDMQEFEMTDAVLEDAGTGIRGHLRVEVQGLAEKRPSVMKGDTITLKDAKDKAHIGFVHKVEATSVVVSFDPEHVKQGTYDLRFAINRTPLRKQHEALATLHRMYPAVLKLIAPKNASQERWVPRDPMAHADVASDGQHAQMLVEKLRGTRGPYAVESLGEDTSRRGPLHLLGVTHLKDGPKIVFDMHALGKAGVEQAQLDVFLNDPYLVKICWDGRELADALKHQFNVTFAGVLDLQIVDYIERRRKYHRLGGSVQALSLESLDSYSGDAPDRVSSSRVSHVVSIRPLDKRVVQYLVCRLENLWEAEETLGTLQKPDQELHELFEMSARHTATFSNLPQRTFNPFELAQAPWAGPFLPAGVLVAFPSHARRCTRCYRSCVTAPGSDTCIVCIEIMRRKPVAADAAGPGGLRAGGDLREGLNNTQIDVVTKILTTVNQPQPQTLNIVFGPPGTGKTVTLTAAILSVLRADPQAKILCTAPSNVAADVITERLAVQLDAKQLFRLNSFSRDVRSVPRIVHNRSFCADGSYSMPLYQEVVDYRVIISTCIASFYLHSYGISKTHFSHVIIDEAGQATESETVVPIAVAPQAHIVLAGDPKQLGPVVRSQVALRFGLSRSMLRRKIDFERDKESTQFSMLTESYRANANICSLYSNAFYGGMLVPRTPAPVGNRYVGWNRLPNPQVPILFRHVQGVENRESDSPSWFNSAEINDVVSVLYRLLKNTNTSTSDISVITPYRKQRSKLMETLRQDEVCRGVFTQTVESFQGQESPVIVISTVRSRPENLLFDRTFQLGFIESPERTNVAISRARSLLVVVGNLMLLSLCPSWRRILRAAEDLGCVEQLPEGTSLTGEGHVGVINKDTVLLMRDGRGLWMPYLHGDGSEYRVSKGTVVQILATYSGKGEHYLRVRVQKHREGVGVAYVKHSVVTLEAETEANEEAAWGDNF
eukprot:Hpha_TRINITY_DN16940_c4_g6::TRINITY_DN16940_c4_g6_i1::g.56511::m.56511/K18422/MOV10; helicase MOV-10